MGLIKIARSADDLQHVPYVIKEVSSRVVLLLNENGSLVCYILDERPSVRPDGSLAIPPNAQKTDIYNDGDLWINMPEQQKVPMGIVGSGYGLGNLINQGGPQNFPTPPPPLVPFAGCDRKAMPPSPMQFKQSKSGDVGKQAMAVGRKISFNDNRQSQISDFFAVKSMEF